MPTYSFAYHKKSWWNGPSRQFHQRFFTRFFRTNVLFGSFSSYILALAPKFCTKNALVNVDEIDGRCQFHQHTNVLFAAFLYLQFSFEIFWWNNICAKATHKLFVKLTVGVNFINISCAPFVPIFCCQIITKPKCN